MKIVVILPGYSNKPIGGYKVAFDYAEHLACQTPVKVHILYQPIRTELPDAGWAGKKAAIARQTIHAAAVRAACGRHMCWRSLNPAISTHMSLSAIDKLGLNSSDAVIATAATTAFTAARIKSIYGARGFYFLQHVEEWLVGADLLQNSYELPLRKIAVAPWIREYLKRLGFSQCDVVMNAIDATDYTGGPPLAERFEVGTLLAPGNPEKGTPIAIEVLNRLAELRIPVQSFGTCKRPANLDRRVRHYSNPAPATLRDFYHRTKVFFCSSLTEGFGLAPAEAALSGAAVVSTRNGGVEAYGEGFVRFCDSTAAAITEAIIDVYRDPQILGPHFQQKVHEFGSYTPETAATNFAELILQSNH